MKEEAMRIDEMMSRNVVTIGMDATCDQALAEMLRWKVRHLPVLDGGGDLRGIVTDRDLRHQLFAPGALGRIGRTPAMRLLAEQPVHAVMSAPAICLGMSADVEEAAGIMRRHRVGSLPVLDGGKVVGILTETDLLRHLVSAEAPPGPELEIIVSYP
jgi:acetoin utilization protein AcuB